MNTFLSQAIPNAQVMLQTQEMQPSSTRKSKSNCYLVSLALVKEITQHHDHHNSDCLLAHLLQHVIVFKTNQSIGSIVLSSNSPTRLGGTSGLKSAYRTPYLPTARRQNLAQLLKACQNVWMTPVAPANDIKAITYFFIRLSGLTVSKHFLFRIGQHAAL